MNKTRIIIGALIGGVLTLPVIGVSFAAERLAGLPFIPFEVFDWLARALPGGIITGTIDIIVGLITNLNLGETSSTAKTIEQIMALGMFLLLGVLGGVLFFRLPRPRQKLLQDGFGLIFGAILALPIVIIYLSMEQQPTDSPAMGALWILLAGLAWGGALHWAYNLLIPGEQPDTAAGMPLVTVEGLDRRQFLVRVGATSAVITLSGTVLGALLNRDEEATAPIGEAPDSTGAEAAAESGPTLPNADDPLTPAPGTRPEYTPLDDHYRIDINLLPPNVDETNWVLPIVGLVDNQLTLSLDELRDDYEPMDQYVTLACISNRVGGDLTSTTRWTGVSLQRLLDEAGLQDGAAYLKITSADGFHETVDLDLVYSDERIMLCYAWDGQPLKQKHGFPLRIYIPDRFGMKQPKWITGIEVAADYEAGYWVSRGWDEVAQMRATSVVDTVAVDSVYEENGQMLIPVGGIAHAGARGISKVEVSVNDGEWQEAELREPISQTTWRIWRFDWPYEEGDHTFAVRCYDGNGELQITEENRPHPSGATGIHSRSATV